MSAICILYGGELEAARSFQVIELGVENSVQDSGQQFDQVLFGGDENGFWGGMAHSVSTGEPLPQIGGAHT
jgi:hypothetical protein